MFFNNSLFTSFEIVDLFNKSLLIVILNFLIWLTKLWTPISSVYFDKVVGWFFTHSFLKSINSESNISIFDL